MNTNIIKNSFFYLEYSPNINPKITYKKSNEFEKIIGKNTNIFKEYDDLKQKIKKERNNNEQIVLFEEKEKKLFHSNSIFINFIPFWKLYPHISFNKLNININKDIPKFIYGTDNLNKSRKNKKFEGLHSISIPIEIYQSFLNKESSYSTIMKDMYKYKLKTLYYLFEYLELGGRYALSLFNYLDSKYIELIYLLSLLFKNIVLFKSVNNIYIICFDFLGQQRISIESFKKILDNSSFCIEPKPDLKLLVNFIINGLKEDIEIQKLLLNSKYNNFFQKTFEKYFKLYINLSTDHKSIASIIDRSIDIHDSSDINIKLALKLFNKYKKKEINSINKICKEFKNQRYNILEIGMGLGIYTKNLYNHIKNIAFSNLIIIDENQKIIWNDIGIQNFTKKSKNLIIYEESPIIALPKVLNENHNNTFGLIFIHSFDTFDKMIYWLVFINLLIKDNGYLVIDKTSYYHVHKFINFIQHNYPFYTKIINNNNLTIFKKEKQNYYELKHHNFNPF